MGRNRLFASRDASVTAPASQGMPAANLMPADWQARAIALGLALELRATATSLQTSLQQAEVFEKYIIAGEQPAAPPAAAPDTDDADDTPEVMGGGGS